MRTLKKSLCLVLALVFVFGLCTIGANAADYAKYTDLADVKYAEAVEVLTGLAIIEGYPDGTFVPGGAVTRAEAAAMIARMMLGREAADKLPVGEVKFSDVAEDNWAAKYIAFCANKGIIVGMGDGTFQPAKNVTGQELACMLLRALGYGVMGEYEGKGWQINAVADALYYKVFKGSDVTDFTQAATREETALYVWNTMWIQLVGYDVDLNYYDGRTYDEEYIDNGRLLTRKAPLNFAKEAYNLVKWDYAQVMANQKTGEPYTVVALRSSFANAVDADGKEIEGRVGPATQVINLNTETDLDLIAHEVTVYFKNERYTDKDGNDYYEVFFIKDVSTVLDKGATYDDTYRALVAANKDNRYGSFYEFQAWENYQLQYVRVGGEWVVADYVDYTWDEFATIPAGGVVDQDQYAQSSYLLKYYWQRFDELKGQVSTNDSTRNIPGTLILDHEGNPLAALFDKYWVAQVVTVDDVHEEVEVDRYTPIKTGAFTSEDHYDRGEIYELAYAYEGIAKDDYVIVQPIGELTYLQATSTKEVDISQRDMFGFNNWAYMSDSGRYGIYIEDADATGDVNVGDKVLFYITKTGFINYFFGLKILEKAGSDGTVYIHYIKAVEGTDEWGDPVTAYKVQAVNEDGEAVVYKMKKAKFEEFPADYQGVYKATVASGYATFKKVEGSELIKVKNKNSYLKNEDDVIYYVTSDTNVYYLTDKAGKLEITAANGLGDTDPATNYTVYAVAKKSGGSYKLNTVWVTETVEAPVDYADSYMFIFKGNAGWDFSKGEFWYLYPVVSSGPAGYNLKDDVETPYFSAYFDGVSKNVYLKTDDENFDEDGKVYFGFYQHIEKDGVYSIKAVKNTAKAGQSGAELLKKGNVKYGRMYTDFCDGVALKVDVVDVAGDTTKETKKDTKIDSVERLEDMLNQGYQVYVWYCYSIKDGNRVPTGTMYVTNVIAPADLA